MREYSGPVARSHKPGFFDQYNSHKSDNPHFYYFNDLGFRDEPGKQFEEDADFVIYLIGCSRTLGAGLRWWDTWACRLKRQFQRRFPDKKIALLNMGQGGASNDYCARMAMLQCRESKPDALFINWSDIERAELIDGYNSYSCGPWSQREFTDYYYLSYNEGTGIVRTIKNVMLLHQFCEVNGIDYVSSGLARITEHSSVNPIVQEYCMMLEQDRICPRQLPHADKAEDNIHPGIESAKKFSKDLFVFWRKHYDDGSEQPN